MAAQAANAMAPDGLDVYEVSRDNLFALALDCTAVAKPPAPSAFKIPRYEAMGLWLAGVTFDLSDNNVVAMLEASNIIEHELRHGDISMLNLEAARNGIFGSKIKHYQRSKSRSVFWVSQGLRTSSSLSLAARVPWAFCVPTLPSLGTIPILILK